MEKRSRVNPAVHEVHLVKENPVRRGESGQSLVELAISIVVLLVLLAGLVDLSRAIITKTTLQDAAEEGVIYAMAYPKNCTQIQYRVLQNLSKIKSATLSSIIVTYNGTTCPSSGDLTGQLIKISISNNFPVSMPFLGKFIGSTRTIKVEAKGIVINSP